MQQPITAKYLPPFMTMISESKKASLFPTEGKDYTYDGETQSSNLSYMMSPTGRHTREGRDWEKTDESFITPNGPN